jgi:zinc/manganese transport system permease protein
MVTHITLMLDQLNEMLQVPAMQHAFLASALIALMSGTVGWFMVLRSQAYVAHTLSVVGFPGATTAVLVGMSPLLGFVGACAVTACVLAFMAPGEGRGQSAVIGAVQAFALALGLLSASRYDGSLSSTTSYLFGSFTGITAGDVWMLTALTVFVLVAVAAVARPLLFATVDASVAAARGVPVHLLSFVFLLVLGVAVRVAGRTTSGRTAFDADPSFWHCTFCCPCIARCMAVVVPRIRV